MKKITVLIITFLMIWYNNAFADGVDDVLTNDMKSNIENAFETSGLKFNAIELIERLNQGDFDVNYKSVVDFLKDKFNVLLKENIGFGLTAFVLIILASMIENVQHSFTDNKTVNLTVSAVVVLSLIGTINGVMEYCIEFVDSLILFINSLIPTLLSLLAVSGKSGTAGVLSPVMIGVSGVIVLFVKSFVVPLNIIGFILKLSGSLTEKNHLINFGNQIQKILKWSLGFVFTVYVGIIGIIGVAIPKVDGITVKTAKYAVSSFIPYAGGMVADSVELILMCSTVVKNSVGIAGLVGILFIAAVPCLTVLIKLFVINILNFFVSPIASKNIIEIVNSMSSCIGVLFAMNIVVSIMYMISVAVIIFIGGA